MDPLPPRTPPALSSTPPPLPLRIPLEPRPLALPVCLFSFAEASALEASADDGFEDGATEAGLKFNERLIGRDVKSFVPGT